MTPQPVSPYIFRAHGIRGVYGQDLDEAIVRRAGQAFAVCNPSAGAVVAGADVRTSSPSLREALIDGLRSAGRSVIDVGACTKAMAVFAGWRRGCPSAYVSASHLPAEWNGLKFFDAAGRTLDADANAQIKAAFDGQPPAADRPGSVQSTPTTEEFLSYVGARIGRPDCPTRVLLDCGNGAGGLIAPALFARLGFEAEALFGEPDGRFPNRPSEPAPEALAAACQQVRAGRFDLGLAFDGDADRVVLIDEAGAVVPAERAAWLILRELAPQQPGPIVANISCSRTIDLAARRLGRGVVRVGVGTPIMLEAIQRHNACFGMESSQHLCIPSLLPFDDGVAVGAYLAWAVSRLRRQGQTVSQAADELPALPLRKKAYDLPDARKQTVIDALIRQLTDQYGRRASTLDGVRVDLDDGWALVRISKTSPMIRLVVEADTDAALTRLWNEFEGQLLNAVASAR